MKPALSSPPILSRPSLSRSGAALHPQESLPFRIEAAHAAELPAVAWLRAQSYGKHLPELAATLSQPEAADFEPGCEVLVARAKLDGTLLGSLRTHANIAQILPLEQSVQLPEKFQGARLIETTRLCIRHGGGASLVRNALFKALYLYGMQQQADWLLAAGRRPVDRIYDSLLFTDVGEPGAYYPMSHAADVPHRVMCTQLAFAEQQWRLQQHHLYDFAFVTHHPDIDLSGTKPLHWARRNAGWKPWVVNALERRAIKRPTHTAKRQAPKVRAA